MKSSCLVISGKGKFNYKRNIKFKEVIVMGKKLMMTAIGLGAAYLMKNKDARDKLINFVQSNSGPFQKKIKGLTKTSD
jgi:hypothetical protein